MPENYAQMLSGMDMAIKSGSEESLRSDAVLKLTGRKPLSFGEFAERNKAVWETAK